MERELKLMGAGHFAVGAEERPRRCWIQGIFVCGQGGSRDDLVDPGFERGGPG